VPIQTGARIIEDAPTDPVEASQIGMERSFRQQSVNQERTVNPRRMTVQWRLEKFGAEQNGTEWAAVPVGSFFLTWRWSGGPGKNSQFSWAVRSPAGSISGRHVLADYGCAWRSKELNLAVEHLLARTFRQSSVALTEWQLYFAVVGRRMSLEFALCGWRNLVTEELHSNAW